MLYRYTCGHVGRPTRPDVTGKPKASSFIRIAEIRRETVEEENRKCPDCRKGVVAA